MEEIFISYARSDRGEAVALADWMHGEGFSHVFLDADSLRAGALWSKDLELAIDRSDIVVLLLSPAWLQSDWCKTEFTLARRARPPKAIIPLVIKSIDDQMNPPGLRELQFLELPLAGPQVALAKPMPKGVGREPVEFAGDGLNRLRGVLDCYTLTKASHFPWPPPEEPRRSPFRGPLALDHLDAGVYFGRDLEVSHALQCLRTIRLEMGPRMFSILGASGSGKSSLLRAGLYARLRRRRLEFFPLPVIRPQGAPLFGVGGLVDAISSCADDHNLSISLAEIRSAVIDGNVATEALLAKLVAHVRSPDTGTSAVHSRPTVLLMVDQAEELFGGEDESLEFRHRMAALTMSKSVDVVPVLAMRSDRYDGLQHASELQLVARHTFDLGPMPRGSLSKIIEGPCDRLKGTQRSAEFTPELVAQLLIELGEGDVRDALPLVAFTLERLYLEYGGLGKITRAHFDLFGGALGSIERAWERVIDRMGALRSEGFPQSRIDKLSMLRWTLIPRLAAVDLETGKPRRMDARLSDFTVAEQKLIEILVNERLLTSDVNIPEAQKTVEVSHDAMLRNWPPLQGWLVEDAGLWSARTVLRLSTQVWKDQSRSDEWLMHIGAQQASLRKIVERQDLQTTLSADELAYVDGCSRENIRTVNRKRRYRWSIGGMLFLLVVFAFLWSNQQKLESLYRWYAHTVSFSQHYFYPYLKSTEQLKQLRDSEGFVECASQLFCPSMVIVPSGTFQMGSSAEDLLRLRDRYGESDLGIDETPQQLIRVRSFAIGRFEVTVDQWERCVAFGPCPRLSAHSFGKGPKPVINVSWHEANLYVRWLSEMTGAEYRLPTEAEWEYAARARSNSDYWWGSDSTEGSENCVGCREGKIDRTLFVGSSGKPNPFGLHDVHGNVREWVDANWSCSHALNHPCTRERRDPDLPPVMKVVKGGAWFTKSEHSRSANRGKQDPINRTTFIGFRVARTLSSGAEREPSSVENVLEGTWTPQ